MTAQHLYVMAAFSLLVFILALMIGRVVYLTGFNRGYHRAIDEVEGDPEFGIAFMTYKEVQGSGGGAGDPLPHGTGITGAGGQPERWPE